MTEKSEHAVAGKSATRTDTGKKPLASGRASGFSPKAVELYKASKARFLAAQKKT